MKPIPIVLVLALAFAPAFAFAQEQEESDGQPTDQSQTEQTTEQTVETPDGRRVRVRLTCAEGQPCHLTEVHVTSRGGHTAPAGGILGDWGLAFAPVFTGTFDEAGPDLVGVETDFVGDLKIAGDLFFHLMAGPGAGWIDGDAMFTLNELFGLQYRFSDDFSLSLGARHRIAFLPEGDELNFAGGELQGRFGLTDWLYLSVSGAIGNTWFPEEEAPPALLIPAGVEMESSEPARLTEDGLGGSATVGLEVRF